MEERPHPNRLEHPTLPYLGERASNPTTTCISSRKRSRTPTTQVRESAYRVPESVGPYRVGEKIASGGMADVFLAYPKRGPDRPVVIKAIHGHLAVDPLYRDMFVREARVGAAMEHPNIVKLVDFFAGDSGLFLVFELVEGIDLRVLLRTCAVGKVPIPPSLAAFMTAHLAEALDYAHSLESGSARLLVHRDVSPSNVLLSWKGRLKLADFGVAETSKKTPEREKALLTGKFGYMSPEQVRGENLDHRSDIFSVGVILAELLMCRRLFREESTAKLLLAVDNANVDLLDNHSSAAPAGLIAIAKRALARDRSDRYQSAGELRDDLGEWLASCPTRTGTHALANFLETLRTRIVR